MLYFGRILDHFGERARLVHLGARRDDLSPSPGSFAALGEPPGFLDEPCPDAVLHWHDHATVRDSTTGTDEVDTLHGRAIGRWRRPEHAAIVGELPADPRARELLDHYGYE